jgi:hypothetical protein
MRKKIAAAGVALTLAGGGAGLALLGPSIAGAADSSSTTTEQPTDTSSADGNRPDPRARQAEALQPLVDDGTITQAQADAVIAALEAARPEGRGPGGGGPGGRGPGLGVAATALGIDAEALRTQLEGGATIAEVAAAGDVDVQTVIDAIVADMESHLAEAVTDGRLTQAEADERSADATERATALVNGEAPVRRERDGAATG